MTVDHDEQPERGEMPLLGDASEENDSEDAVEEALKGRRLQLIPHDVDERYVFRFEFGPAILAQVLEKIRVLPLIPLLEIKMEHAPYPGFYQLFHNEESVYVGRSLRPVAARLAEHARKLRGRVPLNEVAARYLFVEDLSLVGLSEDAMISYFQPLGLDEWAMGFGSKATGHGRAKQKSAWHVANPPDLAFALTAGSPEPRTLRQLVRAVAKGSPVTLSIPRESAASFDEAHPDRFIVATQRRPFLEWIAEIEARLASGWHISREQMGWYITRDG
jgi:hypothetical protein